MAQNAMITKATVVGTGAMGTVSAFILASNAIHVALLGRSPELINEMLYTRVNRRHLPDVHLPQRVVPTVDVDAALASSELVLCAVPCQQLRGLWSTIGPRLPAGLPVCSAIKGIETATLRRPSEIIAELSGPRPIGVLSGPSIAPEVGRCLPCTVVVACPSSDVAEMIQTALNTHWFRVYTNPDVVGVELAGALKNVIALAAGILDGLHAGDNAKAALLTRGLVEISRLGVALGALPQTFMGLAGVGDLVTTCVSPLGRNRSAGERIGRGTSVEDVIAGSTSVIEGIPTTQAVLELARRHNVEMPITQAVHDVLFDRKPPLEAITGLMSRPLKPEDA